MRLREAVDASSLASPLPQRGMMGKPRAAMPWVTRSPPFSQALKGRNTGRPPSLARILIHLVFSTKNRKPWLTDAIRDELHAYIGGIVENQKGTLLKTGSASDHIHLLIAHPRTCAPSDRSGAGNQNGVIQMADGQRRAICGLSQAERLWDLFVAFDLMRGTTPRGGQSIQTEITCLPACLPHSPHLCAGAVH